MVSCMDGMAQRLAGVLDGVANGLLLVVTGAGVSQASGIQTFRGAEPNAVWKTSDVTLATRGYFEEDPVGQWSWYLDRFSRLRTAEPNAAHESLVWLERWQTGRGGRFLLVTQNIDTLHEEAGSENLVKVHGTSDRVRCSRSGCRNGAPSGSMPIDNAAFEAFLEDRRPSRIPTCDVCGAHVRAHVLFFDEYYTDHTDYRFEEVVTAAEEADVVLFVGTSFSVGVTDLFLRSGLQRGVPLLSIDPSGSALPGHPVSILAATAEDLLPATCRALSQL